MRAARGRFRNAILRHLAGGVEATEAKFDADTGRFLAPNGGWTTSVQGAIYPLALLHKTPGTDHHGSERLLEMALRGGDALRDWQDPAGRHVFIKVDGSTWGKIYSPWSMYHWLETYALLRDDLDPARRRRWEKGLTLAYDGIMAERKGETSTHNIPTWHGMALVRAGQIFGRKDWLLAGRKRIHQTVAAQHPDGFWPEGHAPSVSYNHVYVHAIGLYYHFTGDESVLDCLRRALDFHMTFTYPDGSSVETVDGRVRYHDRVNPSGMPGFCLFPQGRAYADLLLRKYLARSRDGGLVPHLASTWVHFPEGPWEDVPHNQESFVRDFHGHALVRKDGPWFVCMSGYVGGHEGVVGASRVRWHMNKQHYLSVFHEKRGLVVGGGNSKHQVEFCTFEYWKNGGCHFEADRIEMSAEGKTSVLTAHYGKDVCRLAVTCRGPKRVDLAFSLPKPLSKGASLNVGFVMPMQPGTKASADGGKPVTISPRESFGWWPKKKRATVTCDEWELALPPKSIFEWPAYPFNPYAIDGLAPGDQARAVATAIMSNEAPKRTCQLTLK